MWDALVEEATTWSVAEIIGVVTALLYLVLAIRQNRLCWVFAGISTAIYIVVFIDAKLYMEAALYGLYFVLAVYGWVSWSSDNENRHLSVSHWSFERHLAAISLVALLVILSGALLERHTDAAIPYLDSATTWLSVWATILVVRKVLENWWYWLLIDVVSIGLYWSRGLELSALLFAVYVFMIPFGYLSWKRSMDGAA